MMFFGSEEDFKEAIDKAHMSGEEVGHNVEHFLGELNEDQLQALSTIVGACDSETFRGYTIGRITQIKLTKYGVCAGCGKKHDDELAAMLGKPKTAAVPEPAPIAGDDVSQHILISVEDRVKMELYYLDDAYEEGTERFVGFICTGVGNSGPCGMTYPSIEDRMRREPDDCPGCMQRAKFG